MQIDTNISRNLTADEKEIFAIINNVIAKYTPSTQCFAVGGWTRDKLLGVPSDDIDIMLSNISGEDFAKLVTKHMGIKDAHTIKSNPDRSKHITTSKAYIPLSSGKTQEIDFAQARQEVYKDNSRIPDIKPATPQEDATRRDLTINSIFYNIRENKIEDFTGMGIKDLISNTIRTPLDPLKTFSDDPLRIFRTIRFSAKYNGKIDPETYAAMTNPQLRDEIKKKVSKERVGAEIEKILRNKNSQVAIQLLYDTGLMQDIVEESIRGTKYEGKMSPLNMPQQNVHHKLNVFEHSMQVVKNLLEMHPEMEEEKRIVMILAAVMHDLGKLFSDIKGESKTHPGSISYHGHEKESAEIVGHILKYLKMEPLIKSVSMLAQKHMIPHCFTEQNSGGIKALRRFIRQCGEDSVNHLDVLNLAIADALAKDVNIDPQTLSQYQELEKRLQEALVSLSPTPNKPELKPILNGNEIMTILNIKPGPHMKDIMEFVKELKDENPNITKEEASQILKDKYQKQEIKQASKDKSETSSVCPRHLLNAKIEEINKLFQENKHYEILTIVNELKTEYGNDDNITRLLSITLFKLLIKDEKYRYNELIQYVLDKAQLNFFDNILCSYCIGILLLLETQTKDDVIKEIAIRMSKMSPGTLRNILDSLPKKIYRPDLKKEIEKLL